MVRKKMGGTKQPRRTSGAERFPLIETALRKQTKANVIELILKLAKAHASLARDLEKKLAIEKPINLLAGDVSSAIDRATDFDEREVNDNFDVNWRAYKEVGQGLKMLVKLGRL